MKVYNLGVEATLDIMGEKWKPLIICFLAQGTKRTGGLQRCIPKISQKVLVQQLRELERDGIIDRTVYNELPPKVEYSITAYGLTLNAIVDTMCQWGKENIALRNSQGEPVTLIEKSYNLQ
ncbi:helix-turn-helix transcriptional regulator [Listeria innocua]|uniref:winged helix-turn-helix transcriptional regulator n=1 Tax=Listeria innocua TaxID=1642 RepID=UPI0016253663|nr:helix-turn-helix domain-containing protein [Listeria innocua]MBC2112151.1 helix-turn-helix transcriptional regulator [Listeria innocua]